MMKELMQEAKAAGVSVKHIKDGHYQIRGNLLVNYYPLSKNKTAYVNQTEKSKKHVTPKEAVAMSLKLPPFTGTKKRKCMKKAKLRLLKKSDKCHWCQVILTEETATVDHVIPLSRGGLDHHNNRVLACKPCNLRRGNSMPELKNNADTTRKQSSLS